MNSLLSPRVRWNRKHSAEPIFCSSRLGPGASLPNPGGGEVQGWCLQARARLGVPGGWAYRPGVGMERPGMCWLGRGSVGGQRDRCWRPGRPQALVPAPSRSARSPSAWCQDPAFRSPWWVRTLPLGATSRCGLPTEGAAAARGTAGGRSEDLRSGCGVALLPDSPCHLALNIPGPFSNVSHWGPTALL